MDAIQPPPKVSVGSWGEFERNRNTKFAVSFSPGSRTSQDLLLRCKTCGVAGRGRDFNSPAGVHSLLEHGPAGVAKAGLLPPQARGDGPNVRDLAGAKPVDVGCAGPFLVRRSGFG